MYNNDQDLEGIKIGFGGLLVEEFLLKLSIRFLIELSAFNVQ